MSTPRPTRSRISSPFVPANGSSNSASSTVDSTDRPKTFMEKWVEPPLPAPRPSFADAGIARHGVVANMAPLGTRPSLKIMKSARAGSADSARYAPAARKSGSALANSMTDSEMTPEPTRVATPVAEPMAEQEPVQESLLSRLERELDETTSSVEQIEQTPPVVEQLPPATPVEQTTIPTAEPSPEAAPSQAQTQAQSDDTRSDTPSMAPLRPIQPFLPAQTPVQPASPSGIAALFIAQNAPAVQRSYQSPFGPPQAYQAPQAPQSQMHSSLAQAPAVSVGRRPLDPAKTEKIVEAAVTHAINAERWPTAYALRILYDDHCNNARIVRLFDSIYYQTATPEQRQEFAILMKAKKKEGRKDDTGKYYFIGDGSDKPVPPAAPAILNFAGAAFNNSPYQTPYQTPYPSTPPRKLSNPPPAPTAPIATTSIEQEDTVMQTTSPLSKDDEADHPNKKRKANDFQASEAEVDTPMNGHQDDGNNNNTTPDAGLDRPRSSSVSSASSLSSIDEGVIGQGEFMSPVKASHTPRANNAESPSHARNQNQPMTSSKTLGPKTHTFSTATLPSSSSVNKHSSSNNDMPSVVPRSSPAPPPGPFFKSRKDFTKVTGPAYDPNDSSSRQRRRAKDVTEHSAPITDSFDRTQVTVGQDFEASSDAGGSSHVELPTKRPKVRLLNTSRRTNYESEAESSPTLLEFRPDLAPGSRSISRASTPAQSSRQTRKTKPGTGLRVKSSPMKKKGGTAGISRAGGERSPVGNGASSHNQEDNDDYCSSCGGNGDLVCCDGCVRSFHLKCVDPPMDSSALHAADEWFCNECVARRNGRAPEPDGIFGYLLSKIERQNSKAFALTREVREYFEGVKTGTEGEYEEILADKPTDKPKAKAGWSDEAPNYFKLKDDKGNFILCNLCHKSASAPDRMIIPCGYCGLSWHLDCLDPPLAKEPPLAKKWRCPAHVDDLLATVPGNLGPAHRHRKIKGAPVITPAFSRGIRNNGYIEIENTPSDDEKDEDFYDLAQYGHVYRLPEEGIKLDFISQVKQKLHRDGYIPHYSAPPPKRQRLSAPLTPFEERTLKEKNCALILAQLASQCSDITQTLIDALLSQAPMEVIDLIAQGDATNLAANNLSERDHASIDAVQAFLASFRKGSAKANTVTPPLEEEPPKPKDTQINKVVKDYDEDDEMLIVD